MRPESRSHGAERRANPRRHRRLRVVIDDQGDGRTGWVLDRSRGGICLEVDKDFRPEGVLKIRPTSAPNKTPWVAVRVKYRRRKGKALILGCKFVDEPSLLTLLLFG